MKLNYINNLFYVQILCATALTLISNSCDKMDLNGPTYWKGARTIFSLENGADPNLAENQDRLTADVWITRGPSAQIFNIKANPKANEALSPIGTLWAQGILDTIHKLTFTTFREAANGKPKTVVGNTYVMHLTEENIYLEIQFVSWSSGGGLSYSRTTP